MIDLYIRNAPDYSRPAKEIMDKLNFMFNISTDDYITMNKNGELREIKKTLTNKIKLYKNYKSFDFYRLSQGNRERKIRDLSNKYFSEYHQYLDHDVNGFVNNFHGSYMESLYELIMANFLISLKNFKNIEIIKRDNKNNVPDFEFVNNKNKYDFECSTLNKSIVSNALDILPKIKNYFSVAEIIKEENFLGDKWYNHVADIFKKIKASTSEKSMDTFSRIINFF